MKPASATTPNSPQARSLSCLVVEDQTMFLQLLVGMLRTMPGIEVRATAKTVAEGVRAVRAEAFDIIVLDLKLPDGEGLNVLRMAVEAHPNIDCVVLSGAAGEFACPQHLLPNLRAIVDKTQAFDKLRDAFAALVRARGVEVRPATVTADAVALLRPREMDVFRLIGQGLATAEICRRLGITKNTVETHRKRIATHLGASGAQLVHLATLHNQTSLPG